ncbi:MAG: hypothetical protein ABFR75_12170 [Acidobacteriota bacterium]
MIYRITIPDGIFFHLEIKIKQKLYTLSKRLTNEERIETKFIILK